MKFQDSPRNWKTSVIDLAIKFFPIQPQQRTKLNSGVTLTLYFLQYLIIFTIVIKANQKIISFESSWITTLVLQILRVAFNLVYLFSKNKIFLCLRALTLFVNCLSSPEINSLQYLPLFVFDAASSIGWALSLQQKNLHFDSRLLLKNALFKKLICTEFAIIWLSLRYYFDFSIIVCVTFCLALAVLDFTDHFYYRKFKKLLIALDLCCIVSALLPFLYQILSKKLQLSQHLFLLTIYLIVSFLYAYVSPHNYDTLYSLQPYARKYQQKEILQYFLTFMEVIEVQSQQEKINFIVYHIRKCRQTNCLLKYHHFRSKQKDNYQNKQILKLFIKQQLINLAKKYAILEDLLIYNYYDRNQIYNKYLNSEHFLHRRQQQRFYQNLKVKKSLLLKKQQQNKSIPQTQSPQNTIQINVIPQIQQFINNSLIFWKELLEYNIDCSKLIIEGTNIIKKYNNINSILKSGVDLTQRSRVVANQYRKYLLGQKQINQKSIFKVQHNLAGFIQSVPTIIVSAQKQNFLSVVDVNSSAIKATGFSKLELRKLTIDQFWDKQIRQDHIKLAQKRANYIAYMSQPLKSYVFLKNKFGYMILSDAKVYYLNDLSGKKWCVVMDPYLDNQAVLVFNYKRELLGVTEHCVAKGIDKDLLGQKICVDIFNECISSKKTYKIKGKKIFQNNNFMFPSTAQQIHCLKFQSQIYFNGRPCYYILTVNMRKQIINSSSQNNRYSQSNMSRRSSLKSKHSVNSFAQGLKMNMDQINTSNFQFNYDWKNKIIKNKRYQYNQNNSNHIDQSVSKQSHEQQIHMTQHESELQLGKHDQDIIEMRLWQGKLDFIQNMQSVNINYESLPQYNGQGLEMQQQKVKQQYQTRMNKLPKNLIYLRVLFIALIVLSVSMIMFIQIGGIQKQSKLNMQLQVNKIIFNKVDKLIQLSTILISQLYDHTLNVEEHIRIKTLEIQQLYKYIQNNIKQFNTVIYNFQTRAYELKKLDDLYRLLIKDYITHSKTNNNSNNNNNINNNNNNNNNNINKVLQYLINNIYSGWQIILNETDNNLRIHRIQIYYVILLCIFSVLLIILLVLYIKLKYKIQASAINICKVFLGIQHRQVVGQMARLRSFKNYIDFDDTLLDNQSLNQIKQQQNSQLIHKKRLVNKNTYNKQLILILITITILIVFACVTCYNKYNNQNMYINHINLLQNMYHNTININIMWIHLNIYPRNYYILNGYLQNFYQNNRLFSYHLLHGIKYKQISDYGKQYLIQYITGDICKYHQKIQPNNCTYNFNGTRKYGVDLLNTIFYRKYEESLQVQYSYDQFINSECALQLFHINYDYYSKIGTIIANVISNQHTNISNTNKLLNIYYVIFIMFTAICAIISYLCTANRIKEILQLQKILHYVQFQVIKTNFTYLQFIHENKIFRR